MLHINCVLDSLHLFFDPPPHLYRPHRLRLLLVPFKISCPPSSKSEELAHRYAMVWWFEKPDALTKLCIWLKYYWFKYLLCWCLMYLFGQDVFWYGDQITRFAIKKDKKFNSSKERKQCGFVNILTISFKSLMRRYKVFNQSLQLDTSFDKKWHVFVMLLLSLVHSVSWQTCIRPGVQRFDTIRVHKVNTHTWKICTIFIISLY